MYFPGYVFTHNFNLNNDIINILKCYIIHPFTECRILKLESILNYHIHTHNINMDELNKKKNAYTSLLMENQNNVNYIFTDRYFNDTLSIIDRTYTLYSNHQILCNETIVSNSKHNIINDYKTFIYSIIKYTHPMFGKPVLLKPFGSRIKLSNSFDIYKYMSMHSNYNIIKIYLLSKYNIS